MLRFPLCATAKRCLPSPASGVTSCMPICDPRVFTIPSRRAVPADACPRLARRRIDRRLSRARAGRWRWRARRSTCRPGAPPRRSPRRCSRRAAARASFCRASRRSAPSSPTRRRRSSSRRARRRRAPSPARGRRTHPPPHARRLVRAWGQALRGAIRGADADGLVFDSRTSRRWSPRRPAQAYALAGDLAALIDDMIIEGVDWRRLETLAPEEYDSYWRITLDFLKIAFAHWPRMAEEEGLIDRAKRVALMVRPKSTRWRTAPARGPTIIAGSTGANRATAELIAAIARSDQGRGGAAGLDRHLDERAWAMIGASDEAATGLAGHPQALLHRLIGRIGVRREEVRTLGAPPAPARRARGIPQRGAPPGRFDRQLARPGRGALARRRRRRTRRRLDHRRRQRDRGGARARHRHARSPGDARQDRRADHARSVDRPARVGGARALGRRGRGFGRTHARPGEAGALGRLVLEAAIDLRPLSAQALIAHPAARFGRARAECEAAARALELGVFRAAPISSLDDLDKAFAAARAAASRPSRASGDPGDRRGRSAPPAEQARARSRRGPRAFARASRRPPLCANGFSRIAARSTRSWRPPKPKARRRTGSRRWTSLSTSGARRRARDSPARSPNMPRCSTTRSPACARRRPAAAIRA